MNSTQKCDSHALSEMVNGISNNSERCFQAFHNHFYDQMYSVALYYTGNRDWASEVVDDVFLKLWRKRSQLAQINNIWK